tara:strand:- start:1901 stop:2209 length:309 start_codon:yes stop_codon:yes gene_type:complete
MPTNKERFNKKYGFKPDKGHSLPTIARLTGISLSNIKKIYQKGLGAHKSNPQSVRRKSDGKKVGGKSLKGKMSAAQWAQARVYSAVMGGPAAKVDKDLLKKR